MPGNLMTGLPVSGLDDAGWYSARAHTAWMAVPSLNLAYHPTHVVLDLGCTRSIGSRSAIKRFQKHAWYYGITTEFCRCNQSFVFANSETVTCKEGCVIHFPTTPRIYLAWTMMSFLVRTLCLCFVLTTIFLCVSPFSPSLVTMSSSAPSGVRRVNTWTQNAEQRRENFYFEALAFSPHDINLVFDEENMKPGRLTKAPGYAGIDPSTMRISKMVPGIFYSRR